MREKVIIIGASGHGKVVADVVIQAGDQVIGFLDDNTDISDTFVGYPVLGTVDKFTDYLDSKFIVAIGNAEIRERIVKKLQGVSWYTAIHPKAVISDMDISIGEGTAVMADAVINAGATIGKHCIINTGAIVEHDNKLEDFVHISVGVKLAGTVHIGKGTWVGIGATVSNNVSICQKCMIGAGAVVVKDIVSKGIYVGVPATCKYEVKQG